MYLLDTSFLVPAVIWANSTSIPKGPSPALYKLNFWGVRATPTGLRPPRPFGLQGQKAQPKEIDANGQMSVFMSASSNFLSPKMFKYVKKIVHG